MSEGHGTWAERVKAIRAALGWNQEQLARRLRVRAVNVSRWENGRATPHPTRQRILERLEEGGTP